MGKHHSEETKKRARELYKGGWSMGHISSYLDVPYATVCDWLKRLRDAERANKPIELANSDRHLCEKCIYRAGVGESGCNYVLAIGRMRSDICTADECTMFSEGERIKEFDKRLMGEINFTDMIVEAIVKQAIKDCRKALIWLPKTHEKIKRDQLEYEIKSLERWFMKDMGAYTTLDGQVLIDEIQRLVNVRR